MDSDLSGVGLVLKCRVAQNTLHLIIIDKRAHCIMPRSFYKIFFYICTFQQFLQVWARGYLKDGVTMFLIQDTLQSDLSFWKLHYRERAIFFLNEHWAQGKGWVCKIDEYSFFRVLHNNYLTRLGRGKGSPHSLKGHLDPPHRLCWVFMTKICGHFQATAGYIFDQFTAEKWLSCKIFPRFNGKINKKIKKFIVRWCLLVNNFEITVLNTHVGTCSTNTVYVQGKE